MDEAFDFIARMAGTQFDLPLAETFNLLKPELLDIREQFAEHRADVSA